MKFPSSESVEAVPSLLEYVGGVFCVHSAVQGRKVARERDGTQPTARREAQMDGVRDGKCGGVVPSSWGAPLACGFVVYC